MPKLSACKDANERPGSEKVPTLVVKRTREAILMRFFEPLGGRISGEIRSQPVDRSRGAMGDPAKQAITDQLSRPARLGMAIIIERTLPVIRFKAYFCTTVYFFRGFLGYIAKAESNETVIF
jgi:hypothetical protein